MTMSEPSRIAAVGVGFKAEHFDAIRESRPALGFFEVHAENYMGAGGPPHRRLEAIRREYALFVHGVGLSIGAPTPLDRAHLARLRRVVERYEPAIVSEHLAWSTHDGVFFNDLLPLPYTEETLKRVCEHVDEAQAALRRPILIENPSTYLAFAETTMRESEFLAEMASRTGCGLLLDVNNIFVSATNHGRDAWSYLADFPFAAAGEIHLGGCADDQDDAGLPLLVDAHDSPVRETVWALYAEAIRRRGEVPTLIEWDNDLPPWATLLAEARRASLVLSQAVEAAGAAGHAL
ncbi:MAG: DUF692 domain-containing protein [Hyphomicrobiales bacterium]|nr:DUF692 domain-containing protein [Hyphomicrobiales bacterium]